MDLSLKMSSNMGDIVNMITTRMASIEERLDKATSTSPAHTNLNSLSREFMDFKTFVWKALNLIKSQMELLSLGHERHEIYQRRKVLLIHGISETKNEKIPEVVGKLFSQQMAMSEITGDCVQSCFRLGHNPSKPRPILVRFKDSEPRYLVWDNKTVLKGSGITISEFLTKSRHNLFMEARKHFGMHNCWSSEGKIVILLPNKSRRKVELDSELRCLINEFPQSKSQDTSSTLKEAAKQVASKEKIASKSRRRQ